MTSSCFVPVNVALTLEQYKQLENEQPQIEFKGVT